MSNQQEPGLISGHAAFAKGAAVETIGSMTGSEAWRSSGAEQKEAGLTEMKEAGQKRDEQPGEHGYGKVEEVAGRLAGCEGMEREGQASETK